MEGGDGRAAISEARVQTGRVTVAGAAVSVFGNLAAFDRLRDVVRLVARFVVRWLVGLIFRLLGSWLVVRFLVLPLLGAA